MSNKSKIISHLLDEKLTGYEERNGEIILEFGDTVLIIEGSYSKDVYAELKKKVITYENII